VPDLSSLQQWMQQHGSQLTTLQLHNCRRAALTALPCAQLQDLLLHGGSSDSPGPFEPLTVDSSVWEDISAATKLTSISVAGVQTASPQQDVTSALTALPQLEQLTWREVKCGPIYVSPTLDDSALLQQLPRLTALELTPVSDKGLQHLALLTKLQHLSIKAPGYGFTTRHPDLPQLKALTSLQCDHIPANVSELTALQQLRIRTATTDQLRALQVLPGLTSIQVERYGLCGDSAPLQLPALQHLELHVHPVSIDPPVPCLPCSTQLRVLSLHGFTFDHRHQLPGSIFSSSVLEKLEVIHCRNQHNAVEDPWGRVFLGPGRLPHLTSLRLLQSHPNLGSNALQSIAACCSSLQVLHMDTTAVDLSALVPLSGLTCLHLPGAPEPGSATWERLCGSVAQLTGLRELHMGLHGSWRQWHLAFVDLYELTALQQLTSLGFGPSTRGIPGIIKKVRDGLGLLRALGQATVYCDTVYCDTPNLATASDCWCG